MIYAELSLVKTTRPIPEQGLCKGAVGTVLVMHADGAGYEVEFAETTNPSSVVTVHAEDVEAVTDEEYRAARFPT